jgi:nucleotide-binding universal stress UspA family protein
MKMLVGYIRSPEGQAALDTAIAEAKLRDAHLIVVHSMKGGARDEEHDAIVYRDALDEVERAAAAQGVSCEIRELVRGRSPSEDLVEFANDEGVDLIVIGLRRRSPVGKLVLGSNAQDILLRADCPVLAVKAGSP